ncbi:UDP-4-amino-4,6-dideoxy-N-acetyl-beta-L-altrosamine N-acetyltransferase [Elusimicrobiota bacterium]
MNQLIFTDILEVGKDLQCQVRDWRNKEEIRKYMINSSIISEEDHSHFLEKLKTDDNAKFWVVFHGNKPIGSVYLKDIDYKEMSSSWGFYIGEDEYLGKGLGKKILFKLLKKVFNDMDFKIIFTEVLAANKIALNLYKKFMFQELEERDGGIVNLKFTSEDWEKNKQRLENECN